MDRPLKRIYQLLPKQWVQPLRNTIEFGGGTMDTVLIKATDEEWVFDKRGKYRIAPGSPPFTPKLPKSDWKRVYDIKYFSRDPRLMPRETLSVEDGFMLEEGDPVKLLGAAERGELPEESSAIVSGGLVGGDKGSPGRENADVARYSRDGLRSTMTASWSALRASLDDEAPDHLPTSEWLHDHDGFDAADVVADWRSKGMLFGPMGRRRPQKRSKWAHTLRDTGNN